MADEKKKALTKSELYANIAEQTGLTKKQVGAVFDSLVGEVQKALSKKGPGTFGLPGLAKITLKYSKATPAQKNVPNPFKPGEMMDKAAKPAKYSVKVRPLKALKGMAPPAK
jgi:nucleoid DNA-binding protein